MYAGYIHVYFYGRKKFKMTPVRAWHMAMSAFKMHNC